jgi:hypothetical protein
MPRRAASAALLALLAALVLVPGPLALATAPSGPKVVIVVGAVEGVTPSFRSDADAIYAEAIKYTSNVVKVYSPNATWAKVKAAAQGASIFVYLGHGYGFPSPYKPILTPSVHDGMGLNAIGGVDDWDKKYYGESYVASELRLAKNAIVILNHLCYSAGSSESGDPEPTLPVARQRVDNFASGFLRAGARAVMADSYSGNPIGMIRAVFTTHQTINAAWHGLYGGVTDFSWTPMRNPAYTSIMRPDAPTSGFHRAITGNLALTTDEIVAGGAAPRTDLDPPSLQAPGAAAVGSAGAALYADGGLVTVTGAPLPVGARVRVDELQPAAALPDGGTAPAAARVTTLDGGTTGWTNVANLLARDSSGPQLWALDGLRTLSPNFDGQDDRLNLVARFSETVGWSVRISNATGALLRTATGTGDSAAVTWEPLAAGVALPDGDYTVALHATDSWANPALDASATVRITNRPIPPSAVLSFAPTTTLTNATAVRFTVTFAGGVTGLARTDFTVTGSSAGCSVGTPVAIGADQKVYTVDVASCGTGRLVLSLEPGTVAAVLGGTGPAGIVTAPAVTVDRTAPTAAAPKVSIRAGVTLSASLAATLAWSATDTGGAGIGSYEIGRSVDGAAYTTLAAATTATSFGVGLFPGHSYRYRTRAVDRASNLGAWTLGPTLYPALTQQTSSNVTWTGSWTTLYSTGYSGGSARIAASAGASSTYAFSGRSIGVVASRGPTRGQVKVYVDGVYSETIDLYASAASDRFIAFAKTFSGYGSHTLRLVVVGTLGRQTVVVDAFEVVR